MIRYKERKGIRLWYYIQWGTCQVLLKRWKKWKYSYKEILPIK